MRNRPFHMLLRDTFYENIDPRRRQEIADSRMISEDHFAPANCPIYPIHREYNQNKFNQSPWSSDEVGS